MGGIKGGGGGIPGKGGGGGGGGKGANWNTGGGGESSGDKSLLSATGSCLSLNLSNLFLREISTPGGLGAFFTRSLATCFLLIPSFLSKEPTIGFSASKVDMSSKTSSRGFCLLRIFLLIGSSFCQKLALFILSLVT